MYLVKTVNEDGTTVLVATVGNAIDAATFVAALKRDGKNSYWVKE
jgi:hypothetical protein